MWFSLVMFWLCVYVPSSLVQCNIQVFGYCASGIQGGSDVAHELVLVRELRRGTTAAHIYSISFSLRFSLSPTHCLSRAISDVSHRPGI